MKTKITLLLLVVFTSKSFSQLPNPGLVGYFHNWENASAPYINLNQIDNRYNIIEIAFAEPKPGSHSDMQFSPALQSQSEFISQIQELQNQGKKVLISIGGANAEVRLTNDTEKNEFINSMNSIISTYGFDGMDIDLEGSSISISGGTNITNPTDTVILNMIDAIEQIMADYQTANGKKLLLTMAPETAYVQGGISAFAGIWGAYLPIIHALRDSIDMLQVQLYNTGGQVGIDGNSYNAATGDFIIAMTEALIQGFNTSGGQFNGLPASKLAVGLPSCTSAAPAGGYINPTDVKEAMDYLMGNGSKPGNYTLANASGYPDLGGMMTWSINWDATSGCAGAYEYAQSFENIFGTSLGVTDNHLEDTGVLFPNPTRNNVTIDLKNFNYNNATIKIINLNGQVIMNNQYVNESDININVSNLITGVYFVKVESDNKSNIFRMVKE
ncbi:glycosyl hydrolase family 18 protein [Aquimarina sp. 2201CG5-10]|uniref:glycosyl hydrolase family 18 protein n=1 Tax=Aquimarina callyspongiae TaxID=3098150 RepID=UPI002AB3689B|nr:glycosyl hydrolase family 18 protein [Aquimarina sp. 2201CG5-10]MDY8138057.1 glycosyl hydrolase family 18 protein [Aquimarina sp. 2201CG5-10]